MQSRTLSELAKLTRLKPRTLQFWTTSGVLVPEAGTKHGGPGVHRKYNADEVMIACVVAAMSTFNFQVGTLAWVATHIRGSLDFAKINRICNYSDAIEYIKHFNSSSEDLHYGNYLLNVKDIGVEDLSYVATCAAMLGGLERRSTRLCIYSDDESIFVSPRLENDRWEEDFSSYLTINLAQVLPKAAS